MTQSGSNAPFLGLRLAKRLSILIIATGLTALTFALLSTYLQRDAIDKIPQRAQFFAGAIDDALARLEHLPYAVSVNPITRDALTGNNPTALNPLLAEIAGRAQAEFVYVLAPDGTAIASSNYQDDDSLVGNSYVFRPYFQDAIAGRQGRFYAVGATTGRPGYFLAEPVRSRGGEIIGVVTVKIGFADLSKSLSESGALVLVADEYGVVITSSDQNLIYGKTKPITQSDLSSLDDQRRFGDQDLRTLKWVPLGPNQVSLNNQSYIWVTSTLSQERWTLHLLSDVNAIRRQALLYVAVGLMICLALIVAAAMYRATQLRNALAISNADRSRLAAEIEDRKRAEEELARAQDELTRQNRLAALGQLSASITHELGQPISAMRNYLVAEEIATNAKPGGVWPELTGLVDRMQRIHNQLRSFGRRADAGAISFDAKQTIKSSVQLIQHTANEADVTLNIDLAAHDIRLKGQPDRFEQVIVNLLQNAIDATRDVDGGEVNLELTETETNIQLKVWDNGPGLGGLDIVALREPFFSTKPSGKGMGLGLAISGQILNEMGSSMSAKTRPDGGAEFLMIFERVETENV